MESLPEIVGIAGTNGAGKDTLADLRHERQGAAKASLSDILRLEATRRGLSHERHHLGAISTEWGAKFGAGALSLMTIKEYLTQQERRGLSVVSIRRPDEAMAIQEQGGLVVWVDADPKVRYERITKRLGLEGRVDDAVDFATFCAQEEREMHPIDGKSSLNMAGVRDIADRHIQNNFTEEPEYKAHLVDRFSL